MREHSFFYLIVTCLKLKGNSSQFLKNSPNLIIEKVTKTILAGGFDPLLFFVIWRVIIKVGIIIFLNKNEEKV